MKDWKFVASKKNILLIVALGMVCFILAIMIWLAYIEILVAAPGPYSPPNPPYLMFLILIILILLFPLIIALVLWMKMKLHSSIMLISGSVIAVPTGIPYLMLFIVCILGGRPMHVFDPRYYNSTALFGLLSGALGIAGGLVASRSVAGTLGIVGSLTSLHGFFGTFGIKFPRIFIESLPPFMEMYEAALALMLIGGILALLSLARDAVRKDEDR